MRKSRFFHILAVLLIAYSCNRTAEEDSLVGIQIQDRNGLSETISIPERLEAYKNTDFLSSQPFKRVHRIYKKEGKNHSILTTYHPNGLVWQYLEAQDMRAYGTYREWFPTGQLKIEAKVIGGTADVTLGSQSDWLFDEESRVWDDQGRLTAKIPYEKGQMEGTTLKYFPNGQIHCEIPYHQNLIEGDSIEYFPNGTVKEKTSYSKGIKQGICLGYWANGQASWIEEYKDDLLQLGSYFNLQGERISTVQNGYGFQTFFDDSSSFQQIEIRKGKQEGAIKRYTHTGEQLLVYQIRNGKKQGEEIEYYLQSDAESKAPVQKISIQWDEDMIHGPVKTWYNNGSQESQKELVRNKKTGTACSWYRDGGLMLLEEYEDDRLIQGQYFKKNQREPISTIVQGNGVATLYDDQGIFLRKVIYHKGKPIDPEN